MKNIHKIEKQLYITNDKEIKEGDWYLYCNQINKRTRKNPKAEYPYPSYQKILLTTDQDLIKDGVQSIDDEFLEWFVKNPSCEFVKVEVDLSKHNGKFQTKYGYKIIITKKEPKQETIEEAVERFAIESVSKNLPFSIVDFTNGYQLALQRSYSKQDMIEFAYKYIDERRDQASRALTPELLIKQFKNK